MITTPDVESAWKGCDGLRLRCTECGCQLAKGMVRHDSMTGIDATTRTALIGSRPCLCVKLVMIV